MNLFEIVKITLEISALILSVTAMAVAVVRTRASVIDKRLEAGSKRMQQLDRRIQAVEQQVSGLPVRDDIHSLELKLSEISGDIRALTETMKGQTAVMGRLDKVVTRHEEHLLNKGGAQ